MTCFGSLVINNCMHVEKAMQLLLLRYKLTYACYQMKMCILFLPGLVISKESGSRIMYSSHDLLIYMLFIRRDFMYIQMMSVTSNPTRTIYISGRVTIHVGAHGIKLAATGLCSVHRRD